MRSLLATGFAAGHSTARSLDRSIANRWLIGRLPPAAFLVTPFLLLICASAASVESAAFPVTVFYSKDDPRWREAERIIDDSVKPFGARVKVEKVSYDDAEGYRRLSKTEADLGVERFGEITAVLGSFALTSSGERRDVENYVAPAIARMMGGEKLKERRQAEVATCARDVFNVKDAEVIRDFEQLGSVYHRVTSAGRLLGWVVDAYRTIHCPVCYDAQMLIAVAAPDLKVLGVRPVRDLELYGKTLDAVRVNAFLKQFEGLKPETRRTLDAIVGATKTSLAYEKSVSEILQTLRSRPVTEERK
jgi:hypothetical protein